MLEGGRPSDPRRPTRQRSGTDKWEALAYVRRQPPVCTICGRAIDRTLRYPDPYSLSADHVIAVSRGGSETSLRNLGAAHLICNTRKGDGHGAPPMPRSRDW